MTSSGVEPGLITVEGVDGAGKSSHLELIQGWLERTGRKVVRTREPGGTLFGENIRRLLLHDTQGRVDADAELLAIFAARAQHLQEIIRPAIARGEWVLSDRFTEATYAYQGGGRELGFDRVADLERWTQGSFRPTLCLVFLVPPAIARQRLIALGRDLDRFEIQDQAFFDRVNDSYNRLAEQYPERIRTIDASQTPEAVAQSVESALERWTRGD